MTECRDCGADIQWLPTSSGKMAWYDVAPVIHFRTCKKRPKKASGAAQSGSHRPPVPGKGSNKGQQVATNPAAEEAVQALVGLGYKKREVLEMVNDLPAAVQAYGDAEAIVRAALKAKAKEE